MIKPNMLSPSMSTTFLIPSKNAKPNTIIPRPSRHSIQGRSSFPNGIVTSRLDWVWRYPPITIRIRHWLYPKGPSLCWHVPRCTLHQTGLDSWTCRYIPCQGCSIYTFFLCGTNQPSLLDEERMKWDLDLADFPQSKAKYQDEEERWHHHITTEEERRHLGTTLAGMRTRQRTKLAPRDHVP